MLVTIIIPFYNERKSILETLESVCKQSYPYIEVFLVDDGSTDNTLKLIENYISKEESNINFSIIRQSNQDQLRAIYNVSHLVNGEYVMVLHADDRLKSSTSIFDLVSYVTNHLEVDGIISDLEIMNEAGEVVGAQTVRKYVNTYDEIVRMCLYFGRQQFTDTVFIKKESFLTIYKESYLMWNRPFWLYEHLGELKMLNIVNIPKPFMQYRVHEGNYINSDYGTFSVLLGEIRTFLFIRSKVYVPFYRLQNLTSRMFNKFGVNTKVIYSKKHEEKNVHLQLKTIIGHRYNNNEHYLFKQISMFFKNKIKNPRRLDLSSSELYTGQVYYGNDGRKFYNDFINDTVIPLYSKIIEEMPDGFSSVYVKSKDRNEVEIALRFLCIDSFVEIEELES